MGTGTNLGRVRGLGSAKHGAEHWLKQRTTAIGNFALFLWLIVSLVRLPDYSFETMHTWLSGPWAAIPMILLVISVFQHFRMGLQVFIEDYVRDEGLKFAAIVALNFYTIGLGATAVFAIAKIAFAATGAAPNV